MKKLTVEVYYEDVAYEVDLPDDFDVLNEFENSNGYFWFYDVIGNEYMVRKDDIRAIIVRKDPG